MARKRGRRVIRSSDVRALNYGYAVRRSYENTATRYIELEKTALKKAESDIQEGAIEKCYITLGKRRVSILPFFANAVSFIESESLLKDLSKLFAKDEEELIEMIKKNERWYCNNIGKENFNILMSLCGHPTRAISRYIVMGALKSFNEFYKIMVLALVIEAMNAEVNGKSVNEYSEGVQNTMALSYYICLKWFRDNGFLAHNRVKIDFIDGVIEDILKVPGPIQDYFNCEIDEAELRFRQTDYIDKDIGKYKMSPLFIETLEAYGINTASKDTISNLEFAVTLANDISNLRTSESLDIFKMGLSGFIMESDNIHKIIKERKYLKKEIANNIETKDKLKKEARQAKRELTKEKNETSRLSRELVKLKEKCNKIPEDTKKLTDNLYKEIFSKKNEIRELSNVRDDLKSKLNSSKKENARLKKQVKKLEAKLRITLEENQLYQEELKGVVGIDTDDTIPFEDILSRLMGKRIIIIGGAECIGQGLSELGLDVKQHSVDANVGAKEIGRHDCIVFMIKYMSHTALWATKSNVRGTDKPMVYYYGTNIEKLCRTIHSEINGTDNN